MMVKGISGWSFGEGTLLADAARLAKQAGFQAIEPILAAEGELTPTTGEAECRRIGDSIRQEGLQVASLAMGPFWETSYTSPDQETRERAGDLTRAALQRANWLGAPVLLVVPGGVSHPQDPARQIVRYSEALRHSHEAIRDLRHDAEVAGVILAVKNAWNQFLISPEETREFLDRLNSPWVAACLDVVNVLRYGFPQDWIDTLGRRLVRVHVRDFKVSAGNAIGLCPLGEGDIDWAEVSAALKRQRYEGPLTYEGRGDPASIAAAMTRLLDG